MWGLTDDASWRRDANPLLFYGNLEKKPAFDAIVMAAKGEEFNMTVQDTLGEIKDMLITFEPYSEAGTTKTVVPRDVGILGRGTGHQATLVLAAKINHTEGATIGYSLKVSRNEQDASMKLDVSGYIGKNVTITAFCLTEDKKIRMGLETSSDTQLLEADAAEDWTELSVNYTIPEDAPAAFIYIETDGKADFYVDDISVVINEDGAAMEGAEDGSAVSDEAGNISESTEESGDNEGAAASGNEENAAETTGMGKVILIVVAVLAAGAAGFGLWKSKKGK